MLRTYKIWVLLFTSALLGGLIFIFWIQFSRYKIDHPLTLKIHNPQKKKLRQGQVLQLMLWNISYGGMPAEIDFFYSGGTQIMLSQENYEQNFNEILVQINLAKDSTDFFLFHKVDTSSKRSYFSNQMRQIQDLLPEFESTLCLNFSVPYIPVPLDQPIGEVHSGMMCFGRYGAESSQLFPLDSKNYYWPKRLFTAQRSMNIVSYPLGNKQLHVINTHLSSYDFQGEYRWSQLKQIWDIADSLEKRGDYIILAGGWNMNPPGFKKYRIKHGYHAKPAFPEIDTSKYFRGWKFDYRMDLPTSRDLRDAYRHGAIGSTIKDFFVCSPNIGILEVHTADQRFKNSDHQAVFIKVFLIP